MKALQDLASRRAAGTVCWDGSNVPISHITLDLVAATKDGDLCPTWEEASVSYGVPTRMHAKGFSLFRLPKALRTVGRSGLANCVDVDQCNAHPQAQLMRHSGRVALQRYVGEREAVLNEVCDVCVGVTRDDAKGLFLRLCYGGSLAKWCYEHGICPCDLPDFVRDFDKEQREIRSTDASNNPELLKTIKQQQGKHNPEASLTSELNMRREREILDCMETAARGMGVVASYEFDGLFIHNPALNPEDTNACEEWKMKLQRHMENNVFAPIAVKQPMTFDEALGMLKAKFPKEDWNTQEHLDETQGMLIRRALQANSKPHMHKIYAEIVAAEPDAFEGCGFGLKDLFKYRGKGEYYYYNLGMKAWTTDEGRDVLLTVICDVLGRRMNSWEFDAMGAAKYQEANTQFYSVSLAESVEQFLRPLLRDKDVELDGEDCRRYVVFRDMAFDRHLDEMVEQTPWIRSTLSTNWRFDGSTLTEQQAAHVMDALIQVELDALVLTAEANKALYDCAEFMPVLRFIYELTGSWERALYLSKHMARAVFALPYNEHLWTRGPGSNGKDTLANLMQCILGDYFYDLPCEALTGTREMDSPSQTLLALKGKRFVAVREMAKNVNIKSHVYKTIADPKGKLKARGLYGQNVEFTPQFLLYLCSNVPVDIDDSSGGSARRTRILDLPFNFVEQPDTANEKQKDATIEASFVQWRGHLFWYLRQVYTRFLHGANQTNVTTVPQDVQESVDDEMEEPWMRRLQEFIDEKLEHTNNAKDASTAADIRRAFLDFGSATPKKEVSLRLARKGFQEDTVHHYVGPRRTTKRVYRYKMQGVIGMVVLKSVRM